MRRFFMNVSVPALVAATLLAVTACGGGEPEERTFELAIEGGSLVQRAETLEVKQDDSVTIMVTADEPVAFHLHGYDIERTAEPGAPATLEFTADATGSFPFTIHVGAGGHSHDANGEESCAATLPTGAPTPQLRLAAARGMAPGEIDVTVELENFVLSAESAGEGTAAGHWHLYLDGESKGMFLATQTTVMVPSPGEYEATARLADIDHCEYGIAAATSVVVAEGSAGGEGGGSMAMDGDEEMEGMEMEEGEEIELGRLEVHPR